MIITAGHTIKEIRFGGKVIGKVMRGDRVVYQRSRLDTTPSLSFAAAGGSQVLSIGCAAGQAWTFSGLPTGWSVSAASGTGPAEVTITAPNNTSTQAVAGTITVTGADKTATCTLSQAAGAKVYGDVVIGTYSYGVIPAGGGTVSPSLTYAQEWTWNGIGGSGGRLASGAAVSYSGSGIDASTGAVSAASKGTTVSGQTTVTTATVAVTMNGKNATTSATVYQAANGWVDDHIELHFDTLAAPNDKTVGAGLSTTPLYVLCYRRYTSGKISGPFDVTSGATFTVSGTGFSISGTSVVAADRGTTAGAARSGTISVRYGNLSTNATITQAANTKTLTGLAIEKYQPDAAWQSSDHWNDIGAPGGNFLAVLGYMDYVFSSEATSRELYSSSHYKSILGQDDGLTLDPSATSWVEYYPPGGLRIKERGTTVGDARKGSVSWTYEGMTSNSIGFTQEANVVVGIAYATPTVSLAVADIPAGGGSVASGEVTYSQEYSIAYSSYATEQPAPLTSGGTVSYSVPVASSSRGTTLTDRAAVGTLTATVEMNGRSGSGSATVYQEANTITGYPLVEVKSLSYDAIPYTGGTFAPNIEINYTVRYTSGAELSGGNGLPPGYYLRYSCSGTGFSIDSETGSLSVGENTGTTPRSVSVSVSVRNPSGTPVASKTITVKQENKQGPITVTLAVSVINGGVQVAAVPKTYDTLQIVFEGADTHGNPWVETRSIGAGVTSDTFIPKGALSGAVDNVEIASVEGLTNPPYTTGNAEYYWNLLIPT